MSTETLPAGAGRKPAGYWWVALSQAALGCGLILLLALQWVYFERVQFARDPILRPHLERMCRWLGCELPGRRDTEMLRMSGWQERQIENIPGALRITATITNNAEFVQAYPILELLFFDLSGNVAAGRRFRPREYLPQNVHWKHGMAPGEEAPVILELRGPSTTQASFQFQFL